LALAKTYGRQEEKYGKEKTKSNS